MVTETKRTENDVPTLLNWEPDARAIGGFSKQSGNRVWRSDALDSVKFPGAGRARVVTSKYASLLGIEITQATIDLALARIEPERKKMLASMADYRAKKAQVQKGRKKI